MCSSDLGGAPTEFCAPGCGHGVGCWGVRGPDGAPRAILRRTLESKRAPRCPNIPKKGSKSAQICSKTRMGGPQPSFARRAAATGWGAGACGGQMAQNLTPLAQNLTPLAQKLALVWAWFQPGARLRI